MLSYFGLVPSGHILDIPNGILGMVYYTYILLRHISTASSQASMSGIFHPTLNLVISSLAMASSLFLGRKLFVLKEICVVCLSTHAINTTLFYRSMADVFGKKRKVMKHH